MPLQMLNQGMCAFYFTLLQYLWTSEAHKVENGVAYKKIYMLLHYFTGGLLTVGGGEKSL